MLLTLTPWVSAVLPPGCPGSPSAGSCHSLVKEGSYTVCFTSASGEAFQGRVEFSEDVCKHKAETLLVASLKQSARAFRECPWRLRTEQSFPSSPRLGGDVQQADASPPGWHQ